MNWKSYRDKIKAGGADDSHYILGLDLGNDSSSLAFYDMPRGLPELLDVSGGYGRASMPTVLQYIPDCREWIFGEYALLNNDSRAVTAGSLMQKMGSNSYSDIDGRPIAASVLCGMFIKDLIGNVRNINPKAEIAGIIASVSGYGAPEADEEIRRAFMSAGYGKELIALTPDRDCILTYFLAHENPAAKNVLLLDYGSRELRAGLYTVSDGGALFDIETENYMFDAGLGTENIDGDLFNLFLEFMPPHMPEQDKWQLTGFLRQHKDLLLQKNNWNKPVKLYFNFTYPPIQATVTQNRINEITAPYRAGFTKLIEDLFSHARRPGADGIDAVICAGGGFEMQWAKDTILSLFNKNLVNFYKNPKGLAAEGAAYTAAAVLGAVNARPIKIRDGQQIKSDVGVMAGADRRERFLPVVRRGAFWWQGIEPLNFILNRKTADMDGINLYSRGGDGELRTVGVIGLGGLPDRPKGATKLTMSMRFEDKNSLSVTVSDCGFGEIYPPSDYSRTIIVNPPR